MKGAMLYVNAGKGHYVPAKALADSFIRAGQEAVLEDKVLKKLTELLSEGTFININEHFDEDEIPVVKQLNLMYRFRCPNAG